MSPAASSMIVWVLDIRALYVRLEGAFRIGVVRGVRLQADLQRTLSSMQVRLKPDPTYDGLRLSDRYMDMEDALAGPFVASY
jgi:hypothetical protein